MRELWARLRAAFADLTPREQVLVSLAGGLLALTLLLGAGWGAAISFPFSPSIDPRVTRPRHEETSRKPYGNRLKGL